MKVRAERDHPAMNTPTTTFHEVRRRHHSFMCLLDHNHSEPALPLNRCKGAAPDNEQGPVKTWDVALLICTLTLLLVLSRAFDLSETKGFSPKSSGLMLTSHAFSHGCFVVRVLFRTGSSSASFLDVHISECQK